jgi:Flp pilus assembly protein TadG
MTVLLSVAALTLDGGMLMAEQQHAQATADAAALAAAVEGYNSGSNASTAATDLASANGYTNDGTTSTVTVKLPGDTPQQSSSAIIDSSGKLNTGYYEVTVEYNQPRFFSGLLGSSTIPLKARSVGRTLKASILTLNTSSGAGSGLTLASSSGTPTVKVPRAIVVDSTHSTAALNTASGSTLKSLSGPGAIAVVGGASTSGATVSPSPVTGSSYSTTDPLSSLAVPSFTAYASTPAPSPIPTGAAGSWSQVGSTVNLTINSGTYTIYPGSYSFIKITGGTVTMSSGTYYLAPPNSTTKPLQMTGGTLTGSNVLIYNGELNGSTGSPTLVGQIQITGGSVSLTPPTSGTWKGISIFQDRNNTGATMTLAGANGISISGAIYAAKAQVSITSASGANNNVPGAAFVVNQLSVTGSGTMTLPEPPIVIPVFSGTRSASLVE